MNVQGKLLAVPCSGVFLEFYLHEQLISVPEFGTTNAMIGTPPSTPTDSPYPFGSFGVSEQFITEGVDRSSRRIGSAPGTFQPCKQDGKFALQKILELHTQEWNGTVVVFGLWLYQEAPNEWTVVGGTGSFRMARGHGADQIIDADPADETWVSVSSDGWDSTTQTAENPKCLKQQHASLPQDADRKLASLSLCIMVLI
ncbi:hypothetical protein R1sor_005548 [Riccia sorocarpa]|uniref:Dirigent protein n=1 Tax=Riccia sorocarpa TaxID=122646 RepID=A0ABD3HMV6_9MARC